VGPWVGLVSVEKTGLPYVRCKQIKSSVYIRVFFFLRTAPTQALGTAGSTVRPQKSASSIQELGITALLLYLQILPH